MLIGAGRDMLTQLCTMAVALPKLIAQSHLPMGLNLDPYVHYTDDWTSPAVVLVGEFHGRSVLAGHGGSFGTCTWKCRDYGALGQPGVLWEGALFFGVPNPSTVTRVLRLRVASRSGPVRRDGGFRGGRSLLLPQR